ncbi:MAG: tetratricopeptide repeat protein [Brumimicrobium sp.]|nr:tetratricopeptide repeat protein [Brumimicrobium sp.]
MKLFIRNMRKIGLLTISLISFNTVMAQKTNVVSAAVEYKKYEPSLMMQKFDDAKNSLLSAKKYIDLAMQDATTKNDEKAHYYNAIINYCLAELSGMGKYDDLKVYQNDSIEGVIKNSVAIASKKSQWKIEVTDFFNGRVSQAVMIGEMMYKQKKYDMAFAGFAMAYKIKDISGIDTDKENMKVNSIISARHQVDTLKQMDSLDRAIEFISKAMEIFPKSEELAIDGVNLALSMDNLVKAEEFFNRAAEAAPTNKVLFSNMGSIFLNQADKAYESFSTMTVTSPGYQEKSNEVEELYGKAEKNLLKALEIDPNYAEAAYNLGVLYLGRGEKLKIQAGQMDFNDPDYEAVSQRAKEMYEKAIAPLEIYIQQDPNNVGVLQVLFQVHRNAGNTEKAMEYKRRADEAGGE